MFRKLKKKWGIESNFQFWLVFSIFAVTGTSMLFLKPPVFELLGIHKSMPFVLYAILYVIIITPIYFIVLIVLGSVLGQYAFFSAFIKRMFSRFRRS